MLLTPRFGGVSVFALQFAQLLGARVIATTSTAEKAERLRALGASEVINNAETPDWDEKAREPTEGRGVDCVAEIGGPGTIAKSLEALAVGGHVGRIMLGIKKEAILDRRRVSQTPDGASIDTVTFENYGNLFPSETENQIAMQHLQPRIVG